MAVDLSDEIFAAENYILAIPETDNRKADRIAIGIAGGIELDRTNEDDLNFVNGLRLYSEVQITVTATVVHKGFTAKPGSDERDDETGYGVRLKIHSLEVPAA